MVEARRGCERMRTEGAEVAGQGQRGGSSIGDVPDHWSVAENAQAAAAGNLGVGRGGRFREMV